MVLSISQFLDRYGTDTTTNFQLIQYAKELGIKPFKVIMRNELKKLKKLQEKNKEKYFIICNYQTTKESGTHWTGIYKDKDKSFYIDSYGLQPFHEAIDFMNDYTYSTFKIQKDGQKLCGQISLYVLYKLSKGEDFYSTVLDLYSFSL